MPSARFHLAVRALHRPNLDLDAMVRVIQRHAQDEEGIAVIGMIARLLNQRARATYSLTDLDRLLTALPVRAAVKRYARALEVLDRHQVHLDEFDDLLLMLSATTPSIDWLSEALSGLQGIGRPVTRLAIIRLRSWATDTVTLGQYMRGVRALMGSGLDEREIDAFLHPHLRNEEATAIAGMIGQLGKRLFHGRLTLEKAEWLFGLLGDRAAVMRYEQAFGMLVEAGIERMDAEALAETFCAIKDDLLWLETCLQHALGEQGRITLEEIARLRRSYSDLAHLYRYFRLRERIQAFPAVSWLEFERLAEEIVPFEDYERILLGILEALVAKGHEESCPIGEIRHYLESLACIAELPPFGQGPAQGNTCDCLSCLSNLARVAKTAR